MTYRIVNLDSGEIAAELTDFDIAVRFADKLAEDGQHKECWAVVESVTRYETKGQGHETQGDHSQR